MFKYFLIFFKYGFFAFGGGYSMIPLIEKDIVYKYKLMSETKFTDIVSISSSLPGAVVLNIGIFVGFFLKGFTGALIMAVSVSLPSFIIVVTIVSLLSGLYDNILFLKIIGGIKPVVFALIFVAGFNILRKVFYKNKYLILVFIIVISVLFLFKGISMPMIIFASILLGVIIHIINARFIINGE